MGVLFVFNTQLQKGNLSRVYILESLGAALSGGIVHFILVPAMSNWSAAAVIGLTCAGIFFISTKRFPAAFSAVLVVLSLLFVFDLPSQKWEWKPFSLIHAKDSVYGKLQMLQTGEQLHVYSNHRLLLTIPDFSSSEEAVHYALLQNPLAKRVLLIGGTLEGGLEETLKYPLVRVDAVELDPEILRLIRRFSELPELDESRYRLHLQDGRVFLKRAVSESYDMIILNLPEPSTARINRFYTLEFFRLCRERLNTGGIIAFRVESAENYISSAQQRFLNSMYATLKRAFPHVEFVPGTTNIFLGSRAPMELNPEALAERLRASGIRTRYVRPEMFYSRLAPLRRQNLQSLLGENSGESASINRDLRPVSYLFHSALWSSRFHNLESRIYRGLHKISRFWLIDLPLIFFVLILLVFLVAKQRSALTLVPLTVLGLTTITVEITVVLLFQINSGSLYHHISLLFTCFMAGLFLGSLEARRRGARPVHLLAVQAGFIILLSLLRLILPLSMPTVAYPLILAILGFLSGELFIISNRIYITTKKNYGAGYGMDLLGSFLGALAAASVLIPLFGLPILVDVLLLLNSAVLIFLLIGYRLQAAD